MIQDLIKQYEEALKAIEGKAENHVLSSGFNYAAGQKTILRNTIIELKTLQKNMRKWIEENQKVVNRGQYDNDTYGLEPKDLIKAFGLEESK